MRVLDYDIPDDLYYSREHEWVRIEGKTAVIGVTDYAQKSLHEVVYVETPKVDSQIEQFQSIGSVESVKSVSDIFTPVSGKIIETNAELAESPELVNEDPYGEGWIVKVQLANSDEDLKKLLTAEQYADYIKSLEE
ncbi:MAG: glycine cleavage system protein GcvH [Candidatus Bathyarchaeota archaeon]|nr:glycine cleavage system protein GcvH [Candidatus Bathyarchaeota archaeon]